MKKTRGFFGEFKEFIMRGNVIDMAIGVVIATAFGKITTSLVDNIIMPFIGWIIGDFDLAKFNIELVPAVMDGETIVKEAVVLGIGTLLTTIINFVIIGFIVFLIVKGINKMREKAEARKKKEEEEKAAEDPKPTTDELLAQILEEIKKK
ncbi:MAG: large conductance mechanosensitive channel protein MscL [Ruminococcaceae bacterium]|nr:large conductance mechanosensitive channel protein MscL [Oscillospiraceae bacterium]